MDVEPEWIILEDYAKTLSVSPTAVKKAIESGRIPASAISYGNIGGRSGQNKRILINKKIADIAWIETENPNQGRRTEEGREAIQRMRSQMETNGVSEPVTNSYQSAQHHEEKTVITLAEAQRRERAAKATLAQLELLKAQGIIVQKDVVYKQLFEAGQQLRDAIMAVPDRIVSEIVAAKENHTLIRKIITEALAASLESLSDVYSKKLG